MQLPRTCCCSLTCRRLLVCCSSHRTCDVYYHVLPKQASNVGRGLERARLRYCCCCCRGWRCCCSGRCLCCAYLSAAGSTLLRPLSETPLRMFRIFENKATPPKGRTLLTSYERADTTVFSSRGLGTIASLQAKYMRFFSAPGPGRGSCVWYVQTMNWIYCSAGASSGKRFSKRKRNRAIPR